MKLQYIGTDLYWDDLLTYMQYLNDVLTDKSALIAYDEAEGYYGVETTPDNGETETIQPNLQKESPNDVTAPTEDIGLNDYTTNHLLDPYASLIGTYLFNDVSAENICYSAKIGNNEISAGNLSTSTNDAPGSPG